MHNLSVAVVVSGQDRFDDAPGPRARSVLCTCALQRVRDKGSGPLPVVATHTCLVEMQSHFETDSKLPSGVQLFRMASFVFSCLRTLMFVHTKPNT